MIPDFKAIIKKEKSSETENICGPTEANTSETGRIIESPEKGYIHGLMDECMMENG